MKALSSKFFLSHHKWSISCILLFVLIAFPDWWVHGVPALDDLSRLNLPQRIFAAEAWRQGQIPFWNPYNFGGQAFLSAGQAGVFYVPNALFVFFSPVVAFKLSYLCHELLAAFGGYALAYQLVKHRISAVVSAIGFATSGFFVGHQIHTQMFDAMCWLPLLFYLSICLLSSPRRRTFAALSVCFAGEIYTGHPQVTFYIGLLISLYTLLYLIQFPRFTALKHAAWVFCSLVGGLGLGAMQWIPTVMAIRTSSRASTSDAFLLNGSMDPSGLSQWFFPFAAGGGYSGHSFSLQQFSALYHVSNYWEVASYTGLFVLLLAITAICVSWSRYEVRIFTCLLLIFVNLALGNHSFFSGLLTHGPGFSLFRVPARYIGLTDFMITLLAPFALQRWFEVQSSKVRYFFGSICLGIGLCLGGLTLYVHAMAVSTSSVPLIAYLVPCLLCLLLALICLLPELTAIRYPQYLVALLAISDCVYTSYSLSLFPYEDSASYLAPSSSVQFLTAQMKHADVFTRILADPNTSLGFDQSSDYHLSTIDGYDSLEPAAYAENVSATWDLSTVSQQPQTLLDDLGIAYAVLPTGEYPGPPVSARYTQWTHTYSHLPDGYLALQVTLSSVPGTSSPQVTPLVAVVLQSGSRTLVNNIVGLPTTYAIDLPTDWPRTKPTSVHLVNISQQKIYQLASVAWMTTGLSVYDYLPLHLSLGPKEWLPVHISPTETVWRNPDPVRPFWSTSSLVAPYLQVPSEIRRTSFALNQSSFQVTESKPQWLVLSQSYDAGWHVWIDGRPVTLHQVEGMLSAVQVAKGTHSVVLTYRPIGFRLGMCVSGLVMLVFLVWFASLWLRNVPAPFLKKGRVGH